MDESESGRPEVAWNLAERQSRHIHSLVVRATTQDLRGDILGQFKTLTALRSMINYDLNDKEKKELDDMEEAARKPIYVWNKYKDNPDAEETNPDYFKSRVSLSRITRDFLRRLMDLLKKLGYFPDKEDRSRLGF